MLAIIITAFASAALTASVFGCLSANKHSEDERKIKQLLDELDEEHSANHNLRELVTSYSAKCKEYQAQIDNMKRALQSWRKYDEEHGDE
ncbi:MAG: hypothetical protein ACI4J7_05940 [Ruminiclostridium sp.]